MKRFIAVTVLFLSTAVLVHGQEYRGTILGRVSDAQDATIPGALVTIKNTATSVTTTVKTNEAGDYYVPFLIPGPYELKVEHAGFKTFVREGIDVRVQDRIRLDVRLEVGQLTESVTVTAAAPLLDLTSGARGELVTTKMITELPLSSRTAFFIVRIVPGVSGDARTLAAPYQHTTIANFDMSGGVRQQNEILLDGVTNTTSNYYVAVTPTPDAIEDIKVQVNAYDAEYGRTTGGIVNAVTKSGTNELHGNVHHFHQNRALNSNDFLSNKAGMPKFPWLWNQFGFAFGGPVYLPKVYKGRDRTFFFVNYEGLRHTDGRIYTQTVPTPLQRQGDFSQTRNSAGQVIQIYDPFSTRPDPSRPSAFIRDPFPGNLIPKARQNPFMAKAIQYYPLPSRQGDPVTGVENRFIHDGNKDDNNMVVTRVDHSLTDKQRISGRGQWSRRADFGRYLFGEKDNPANPSYQFQPFGTYGGVLDYTNTLAPSWLMNVRYGYSRYEEISYNLSEGYDLVSAGMASTLVSQMSKKFFPRFDITGMQQMGREGGFTIIDATHTIQGVVTKILRSHNIRIGGDYRLYRKDRASSGYSSGYFRFNAAFTQGPDPVRSSSTAGIPVASALLGAPYRGDIDTYLPLSYRNNYAAIFVQDDIRVTRRLTLNIGFRFDHDGAWRERQNRMTRGFAFDTPSPLQAPGLNLRGGLLFAGVDGQPESQTESGNVFAPRFSFAYQLRNRTVIRGGYGTIFSGVTHFGDGYDSALGFTVTTPMVASLDGVTPLNTMSNPFPDGLLKPIGSSQGLRTLAGYTVQFFDPARKIPRNHQFSLSVSQQFGASTVIEASYAGARLTHFPMGLIQWNQLPPRTLTQYGNALLEQVTNPFYGQIASGPLSQPTVARGQLLRPFPQFDGLNEYWATRSNSSYHSLQWKFDRRFSRGLSIVAAHTFSKRVGNLEQDSYTAQNNYDLTAENSVLSIDNKHRFTLSTVAELPFGRGKWIGANASPVLNRLISGWQFNALVTLVSGSPLGFTVTPNTTNALGGVLRPNSTGASARRKEYQSKDDMLTKYFDTAHFVRPAPFTFGNVSRRTDDVRGPNFKTLDMSLVWKTAITEKVSFQLRAEAYNALNRTNWGNPNAVLGNSQFGRISSLATSVGATRTFQFGAKISF